MRDPRQALTRAWKHQQAGEVPQAEALCAQLVRDNPRQADAWALLGILACQAAKAEKALECFGKAVTAAPGVASFRNNRGAVLQGLGRHAEAELDFRAALRLDPRQAELHYNLGTSLRHLGRAAQAEPCYRRALELRPDYADAHAHLGAVLRQLDRLPDAEASFRRALELKPDHLEALNNLSALLLSEGRRPDALPLLQRARDLMPAAAESHQNLGNVLRDLERDEEAVASYRRALELKPDEAGVHNNLGVVLWRLRRHDEAAASYGRALELSPDCAETHHNLGAALRGLGRFDEAVARYERALALLPADPETQFNLGNALRDSGRCADAEAAYRRALEMQPHNAEFHHSLALLMLLMGDFERGWVEYEWRWRLPDYVLPDYPQPLWDGAPIGGRTILLHSEQGFGDTIQFIRYAAVVKDRGATVMFQCRPELLPILRDCPGIDLLLPQNTVIPAFDVHAPLLSLPRLLGTTAATVPARVPYLATDRMLAEQWRSRLAALPGLKVGIVWQGNSKFKNDRLRSIPLAEFAPLAGLPNCQLLSLQVGPGREQLAALAGRFPVTDLGGAFNPATFSDVAAVVRNLDLVISVDSALAHLAGALGVPVWVALPFAPDWRWLRGRDDSPWYPGMRLFRQTRPGAWSDVFARMSREAPWQQRPRH